MTSNNIYTAVPLPVSYDAMRYIRYILFPRVSSACFVPSSRSCISSPARSDNVLILQAGDVEIRILKDTKECYIDADTFGVNGSVGLTGRVEYSDDTYADYVGGILVGGKSKEGDF